jgi:hypothetical protein
MKITAITLTILLIAAPVYSTTVVAVITSQGIIIGSDAKRISVASGIVTGEENIDTKIQLIAGGRILVASSGIMQTSEYNFFDWIKKISVDLPNEVSVEDFALLLKGEAAKEFDGFERDAQIVKGNGSPLDVCNVVVRYLVAGYQNGHPMVYTVEIYLDWEDKRVIGPILTLQNSDGVGWTKTGIAYIGESAAIREITNERSYAHQKAASSFPETATRFFNGRDLNECEAAKLIRGLIKVEEEVSPSKVGGLGRFYFIPRVGPIRESKCILASSSPAKTKTQ